MPNGNFRIELTLPGTLAETRSRTTSSIDFDASPGAAAFGAEAVGSPETPAHADSSRSDSAAIGRAFIGFPFASTTEAAVQSNRVQDLARSRTSPPTGRDSTHCAADQQVFQRRNCL